MEDAHTYCMAENVLDIMVALYSFKAQNDTELSFDKGDRLEIIDRPAADPDWYKARNTAAQVSNDNGVLLWGSSTERGASKGNTQKVGP